MTRRLAALLAGGALALGCGGASEEPDAGTPVTLVRVEAMDLREEIETADLDLVATLTSLDISLRQVAALRPGDVIAMEMPEAVIGRIEDIPVLRARFGRSRTNLALKVIDMISRDNGHAPVAPGSETDNDG